MRACLMLILLGGWGLCIGSMAEAQVEIQPVAGIDAQPLKAQIKRLVQALEFLGQPLPQATQAALDVLMADAGLQSILLEAVKAAKKRSEELSKI